MKQPTNLPISYGVIDIGHETDGRWTFNRLKDGYLYRTTGKDNYAGGINWWGEIPVLDRIQVNCLLHHHHTNNILIQATILIGRWVEILKDGSVKL